MHSHFLTARIESALILIIGVMSVATIVCGTLSMGRAGDSIGGVGLAGVAAPLDRVVITSQSAPIKVAKAGAADVRVAN
jgi:hypothetical protein